MGVGHNQQPHWCSEQYNPAAFLANGLAMALRRQRSGRRRRAGGGDWLPQVWAVQLGINPIVTLEKQLLNMIGNLV
jgi:hypothetical protein